MAIHEWNQRDSTIAVQRKLETLADANPARGIPWKTGGFARSEATKQSIFFPVPQHGLLPPTADKSLRSQ
jgi:hypothetical protein